MYNKNALFLKMLNLGLQHASGERCKSEEGEREVRRDFTVAPTVTTFKLEQNILQLTFLPFHLSSTITSSVCLWWALVLWEIGLVIAVVESSDIFMACLKASDGIFTCISLSHTLVCFKILRSE